MVCVFSLMYVFGTRSVSRWQVSRVRALNGLCTLPPSQVYLTDDGGSEITFGGYKHAQAGENAKGEGGVAVCATG